MMRSLFAGVSGIRNHQTRMDVIGNNISNVNTVGFKSGRVNFKEVLSLTLRGARRPVEDRGGVNPVQVGLGMNVASIDTLFSQGNIENTGQITDLAVDGKGFFVLNTGNGKVYTRAGGFTFDANGRFVDAISGWSVQGRVANGQGEIPENAPIEDIVLPFGQKVPAKATTELNLTGNLNAGQEAKGTILNSSALWAIEEAGDDSDINGLFAGGQTNSKLTSLIAGVTTVTINDGTTSSSYTYVNSDTAVGNSQFTSLDDLIAEINADYAGSLTAALDANGAVEFTDTSGGAQTLTVSSNSPTLNTAFSSANGTIDSTAGLTTTTDEFSHAPTEDELLVNLRNSDGTSLGLAVGDDIELSAEVNTEAKTGTLTVAATTTLGDLMTSVYNDMGIENLPGVSLDTDQSLKIGGDPGEDQGIDVFSLTVTGNTVFNSAMAVTESQAAADVTHSTSVTVYDALGEEHFVTIEFKKADINNQWTWEASLGGDEIISSGSTGRVTFADDGSLASFSYDNGLSSLIIDPNNGAAAMDVKLQMGEIGSFDGVTQFASTSNALVRDQDGFTNGDLLDVISVDDTGKIEGIFSNGINRVLAQISMSIFQNPAGLARAGNNAYRESGNSGIPIIGAAGEDIQSKIIPGALEMSNVDLAQEFTNMIIAQRGFQANSRVITTSDEMLTELVNLKR